MLTRDALAELDDLIGILPDPNDPSWNAPTRCAGWNVRDLVAHVVAVAWQQAEAFHRSTLRSLNQPSYLESSLPAPELAEGLISARRHLATVLATTDLDPAEVVPLPWAPMPYDMARSALVLEYGAHRNDLLHALGRPTSLPPRVCAAVFPNLAAVLSAGSRDVDLADAPTVAFSSPSVSITIAGGARGWTATDAAPTVRCSTDDSTLTLFALGRIRDQADLAAISDSPDSLRRWFGGL